MSISMVSSKGQITLPVRLRRAVGIAPHDRVMIEAEEGRIIISPLKPFAELAGSLGQARSRERDEMARGLAEHVERTE
jgi:AbrB family looped-hinge helix DNA binding protein